MSQNNSNEEIPERPAPIDPSNNLEIERLLERIAALENKFETSGLSQEAAHRGLRIDDLRQRMCIRTVVMCVAIIVLCAMFGVLLHAGYQVFLSTWTTVFPARSTLVLVAIVAPIASITTISALLMIGAFRGFKDSDMDVDKASLLELARAGNGN